jgi:hypothetical protein
MFVRFGVLVRFGVVFVVVGCVSGFVGVGSVLAASPWWGLSSSSAPAVLQRGPCEGAEKPQTLPQCGQVVVRAENLGDLAVTGFANQVLITDVLPAEVRAMAIASLQTSSGFLDEGGGHGGMACSPLAPAVSFPAGGVTCAWSESFPLPPYELLEVAIEVEVGAGAVSGGENEVRVSGGEGDVCEKQEGGAFTTGFCAGIAEGVPASGSYEAHLTGQEVAPASLERPLAVGGPTLFGVEEYSLENENEGGAFDTQAGSHPFQQTTNTAFNQGTPQGPASEYIANPPALPKDLHFQWPPGLIGNPVPIPQCTEAQFSAYLEGGANECPAETAVGVASATVLLPHLTRLRTEQVPVFNLVPGRGEPARFGFEVERATVIINPTVRTGGDYGITVNVENITQLAVLISSRVTVWGVPGDRSHDGSRGWGCMEEGKIAVESSNVVPPCAPEGKTNPPPFLSLPTSCTGPLKTSVRADSWQEPKPEAEEPLVEPFKAMPALDGCNRLPFAASMEVAPDVQESSSPTGLTVKVHIPQEASLNATGLEGSDVKDTTVVLPEGITTNPAGANGLEACSEGLVGFTGFEEANKEFEAGVKTATFTPQLPGTFGSSEVLEPGVNFCPDASKIATAKITVPVLAHPLEGAVYLASQNTNPFGSLIAMYIVAEDPVSGVLVKLPGEVKLNPETGQLVSTFENTPQAPFENLELHFFGGERAPLATPAHCGTYPTSASFTPWSGNAPVSTSTSFNITSGPNGSACPGASLPFAPSFTGGSTNLQASAFSDLDTAIGREDGNQDLQSVQLHFPPGLTGLLSGVKLCGEPQADEGLCPPESKIGETTVSVGLGGDPYTVTGGEVFITGPYNGAPFGLSIKNPAKAGPFDVERDPQNPEGEPPCDCVVTRAKVEINPTTAALTVSTNSTGRYAIPHILDGIPLQIKHVAVTINRPGFTINPTNCSPMAITGTLNSSEGASSPINVPFQVTNCATLGFAPKFTVTTSGKTSKANGASLTSRVSYPYTPQGTQANIAKVKVDLPKQLPSRLTTLQKACLAAVFEANPSTCPPDSIVGHAIAYTPLLPVPLTGPAYFVSHGGEAFPSLTMVLQGYGVTIDLVGSTFIHDGITSTTFKQTPDSPVSTFELTLPEGPYSALTANANLCQTNLEMPTLFVAQNGAEIHQTTTIHTENCPNTLTITKHTTTHHTTTLTITVPTAGKLTATTKTTKTTTTTKGHETIKLTLKTPKPTTIHLTLTTTNHTKTLTTTLTTRTKN